MGKRSDWKQWTAKKRFNEEPQATLRQKVFLHKLGWTYKQLQGMTLSHASSLIQSRSRPANIARNERTGQSQSSA